MPDDRSPHAAHDLVLVAALAADDLEPADRAAAETLARSCPDCALLLTDLRSIALATHALPPVVRRRDFRLSPADAARLRPRGWRAVVDAIGGVRATFSRPLAVGLTTLGLVGMLLSTVPGLATFQVGSAGTPASVPEAFDAATAGPAGPSNAAVGKAGPAAASVAPPPAASAVVAPASALAPPEPSAAATAVDAGQHAPASSPASSVSAVVLASPSPGTGFVSGSGDGRSASGADGGTTSSTPAPVPPGPGGSGPAPLLVASLVCLVAGLGLFAIRWVARRSAPG